MDRRELFSRELFSLYSIVLSDDDGLFVVVGSVPGAHKPLRSIVRLDHFLKWWPEDRLSEVLASVLGSHPLLEMRELTNFLARGPLA